MLTLSAEAGAAKVVEGIPSYCVPHYHSSKGSPLAVARKLSRSCKDITYTQVCRGVKSVSAAKKALAAAAEISSITTVLCVTGDHASNSDISVFEMLKSVGKKRFRAAAAIVFTRNGEALRVARKAAAGAAIFYTQPVFPKNAGKLLKLLKQLPRVECEIRIGVLIPFSSSVCRKVAGEKPDFISDNSFVPELEAAERKSAAAAYKTTLRLARESLNSAIMITTAVNSTKASACRVAGIHLYGLSDRIFGKGSSAIRVSRGQLLGAILDKPGNGKKKHKFKKGSCFPS